MNDNLLSDGKRCGQQMSVSVPGEEQQLEYQDTDGPYGRGAAENRKDFLAEQQLHLEEQERTQENPQSERQLSNTVIAALRVRSTANCGRAIAQRNGRSFHSETHQ